MSKFSDATSDFFGELIALAIGWGFCMAMVGGFYGIGFWLAPYFGGDQHRDAFGIMSAIVFIWLYERRQADERWERLKELIGEVRTPR